MKGIKRKLIKTTNIKHNKETHRLNTNNKTNTQNKHPKTRKNNDQIDQQHEI